MTIEKLLQKIEKNKIVELQFRFPIIPKHYNGAMNRRQI